LDRFLNTEAKQKIASSFVYEPQIVFFGSQLHVVHQAGIKAFSRYETLIVMIIFKNCKHTSGTTFIETKEGYHKEVEIRSLGVLLLLVLLAMSEAAFFHHAARWLMS
jgi:hypothetical protein